MKNLPHRLVPELFRKAPEPLLETQEGPETLIDRIFYWWYRFRLWLGV